MAGEQSTLDAVIGSASKVVPLGAEIKEVWDKATGGVAAAMKAIEQNVSTVEKYRIQLTQASGATSKFAENLRTEVYALNQYGVSYEKLVAANVAIAESYSRATFTSAKTREGFEGERKAIQELVTVNERFGVGQQQTIDLANKLTNSVFNSVGGVTKFSDTLLKFSKETGQPFNKVLQQFGEYSDRFITAISSDKATQAFTTLELLARRAGTSVNTLVGSISKFDDIDEAFSSGGQINRVLSYFGGSLDTLAMASASDEEKTKMLLESISSISEQFNTQMTDPNARRSVLKELQKQTGLDLNTITGLLNKNNDLSKDLQSIIRTPVVTGMAEIPESEKKKMAMDVTTQAELEKIAKENINLGPLTFALERMVTNQKGYMLEVSSEVSKAVDKSFAGLLKTGDVPKFLGDFGNALDVAATKLGSGGTGSLIGEFSALLNGAQGLGTTIKKLTGETAGDKVQEKLNKHTEVLHKNEEAKIAKQAKAIEDAAERGIAKGVKGTKMEHKIEIHHKNPPSDKHKPDVRHLASGQSATQ